MCLGIPGKIIEIKGWTAKVEVAGTLRDVNLRLMEDAKPGDYVIVHAGFAIEKVDEEQAAVTMALIDRLIG